MSLPLDERKFVIVIPDKYKKNSNGWITSLALPYFSPKPEGVIGSSEVKEFQEKHPDVSRAVYLDDAAFSGKQFRSLVREFPHSHAIIPFMTKIAMQRISFARFWIADHERMLGIDEACTFDKNELEQLKKRTDSYDQGQLTHRSLTYFDHKTADGLSTLSEVLRYGQLISGGFTIPFIPRSSFSYISSQ